MDRPGDVIRRDNANLVDIESPNTQEALSWLLKKDDLIRSVGGGDSELTRGQALWLVRDLYRRGAVKVYAVNIDTYVGFEDTDTLIVELPEAGEMRRFIFERHRRVMGKDGWIQTPDIGQKYLKFWWD